jgi:hypothetical protein
MSSRLESLANEVLYIIFEIFAESHLFVREYCGNFKSLRLTSKKCRSYTTRYIFRRLFIGSSLLEAFVEKLTDCLVTLERLDVLHLVEGLNLELPDFTLSKPQPRKVIIEFLKKVPSLMHLHIRAPRGLDQRFLNELDETLADRCERTIGRGQDSCWHWWTKRDPARLFRVAP